MWIDPLHYAWAALMVNQFEGRNLVFEGNIEVTSCSRLHCPLCFEQTPGPGQYLRQHLVWKVFRSIHNVAFSTPAQGSARADDHAVRFTIYKQHAATCPDACWCRSKLQPVLKPQCNPNPRCVRRSSNSTACTRLTSGARPASCRFSSPVSSCWRGPDWRSAATTRDSRGSRPPAGISVDAKFGSFWLNSRWGTHMHGHTHKGHASGLMSGHRRLQTSVRTA